jgi:murein DD-endopeptidase MepM/ murein hydrolase activator NlpD
MNRRIPEYYTLWLGRTGQDPWVLQFKPIWLIRATIAAATAGVTLLGIWVYQRASLQARQAELNRQAENVIEQIEALERDLEELRRRSGSSKEAENMSSRELLNGSKDNYRLGQGGELMADIPALEADTREKLANAQHLSSYLKHQLSQDVRPALEATLAYEAAIPHRKPIADSSEMTSTFGKRPNPFGFGAREFHNGLDFVDDYGAPVFATAPGTVMEAGYNGGYGNQIVIEHKHGYQTLYAHLSEIEVEVGDRIESGDTIGALGNSGRSTGPHLHYEVRLDDQPINPQNFLKPASIPIANRGNTQN